MTAGGASEAAWSAKKSYRLWKTHAHQKAQKKTYKKARKIKTLKNTDLVALGAAEGTLKERSGRGPKSDLVEDSMFF